MTYPTHLAQSPKKISTLTISYTYGLSMKYAGSDGRGGRGSVQKRKGAYRGKECNGACLGTQFGYLSSVLFLLLLLFVLKCAYFTNT